MATQQDEFAVSFDDGEVKRKISELVASNSEDELRSKYPLCTTDQWSYQRAKNELATGTWKQNLFDYAYRPFSTMRSVFDRNVISILRAAVMKQLVSHNNIALVASRVVNDAEFAHIFVTDKPVDKIFLSSKTSTNAYVFQGSGPHRPGDCAGRDDQRYADPRRRQVGEKDVVAQKLMVAHPTGGVASFA